ncbi:MAG: DUF2283 domain-containing protein [Dehalococcoidia bacterium]|nr:DUF2283 domain-containing protein [Dehalococcoidia bacterium]
MGRTVMKSDAPQIDSASLTLDRIKTFQLSYHDDQDVLFVRSEPPRPATSLDLEGEIWVRFDPETGEIVGFEIEDFEAIFLKKHPEVAQAWKEVKPLCHRRGTKKGADMTWESFLLIIVNFLLTFFRENPRQTRLDIVPTQA